MRNVQALRSSESYLATIHFGHENYFHDSCDRVRDPRISPGTEVRWALLSEVFRPQQFCAHCRHKLTDVAHPDDPLGAELLVVARDSQCGDEYWYHVACAATLPTDEYSWTVPIDEMRRMYHRKWCELCHYLFEEQPQPDDPKPDAIFWPEVDEAVRNGE